jgi:transposase
MFHAMKTATQIEQLKLENKQLQEVNASLNQTIFSLKEQIEWFQRQIFGKRSEKIVAELNSSQAVFSGFEKIQCEAKSKQVIERHERKKPNRDGQDKITLPENLPTERIYLDVSEEEKFCQETGEALVKIGEEITRKLANKPGSYYVKEIVRPKYAHPKKSENGIKIAPLSSFLTRCQADNSFLADILVKKYADHLPLYRISEMLGRDDISISRQILSKWIIRSAKALKPLYEEMKRQILDSGNVFIDETPVKMLDPGAGQTKQTFMWVLSGGKEVNPSYRVYNFRTSRQHHHAKEILKGFKGVVHSDKYGAYETLAQAKKFTWCPCWVHIRRKFFEAINGDEEFREMALSKINALFLIEELAWTKPPDERLKLRQEEAVPIIDELTQAVKDKLIHGNVLPKSNLKEALGYYYSLVPYLKNYTLHCWARLDNNVSERAVRPLALGRKNWLFLGNEDGGEAAAIALSLIQTCRALKINPRTYLESVMDQLMDYNSKKLVDLLPDNWAKTHLRQS